MIYGHTGWLRGLWWCELGGLVLLSQGDNDEYGAATEAATDGVGVDSANATFSEFFPSFPPAFDPERLQRGWELSGRAYARAFTTAFAAVSSEGLVDGVTGSEMLLEIVCRMSSVFVLATLLS